MVKQATKGQKEIYEDNRSTILTFGATCLIVVVGSSSFSNNFAVFLELFYYQFIVIGARFDERGRVIDAGMDLNDPAAFGEYCKDAIILTTIAQIIALYSTYAYLILLLIPATAAYKCFFAFPLHPCNHFNANYSSLKKAYRAYPLSPTAC
ncbi:unnamed protein product [Strongylus vulgaris]|uniref:Transmembrane protein 208 n=1 Tax=Strongylus vulgaris TaxID=40348 RepID=A0A3P7IZG3_STRVU|nr:unnamed protein product [Strongylus vulgaris]